MADRLPAFIHYPLCSLTCETENKHNKCSVITPNVHCAVGKLVRALISWRELSGIQDTLGKRKEISQKQCMRSFLFHTMKYDSF